VIPVEELSAGQQTDGLIKCPYCAEEIKAAARKCKHCGEWLRSADKTRSQARPSRTPSKPVQTIEKTSKKWKEHQLYAGGIMFIGFILLMLAATNWSGALAYMALTLLGIGFVYWTVIGMAIWWHHE